MATVLLALEHNEPLDEILFTEVMFDHARNISGEIPEHNYLSDEVVQKLLEHKRRNAEAGNGFEAVFHSGGGKMHALKIGGKGVDDLVLVE